MSVRFGRARIPKPTTPRTTTIGCLPDGQRNSCCQRSSRSSERSHCNKTNRQTSGTQKRDRSKLKAPGGDRRSSCSFARPGEFGHAGNHSDIPFIRLVSQRFDYCARDGRRRGAEYVAVEKRHDPFGRQIRNRVEIPPGCFAPAPGCDGLRIPHIESVGCRPDEFRLMLCIDPRPFENDSLAVALGSGEDYLRHSLEKESPQKYPP